MHRIASLERELEDAKARAEAAEERAGAAEAVARAASASLKVLETETPPPIETKRQKRKKKGAPRAPKPAKSGPSPAASPSTAPLRSWRAGGRARYRQLTGVTAIAQAPAAVVLWRLPSAYELGWTVLGGGIIAQLVLAYVIGRECLAPSPMNGVLVLLLAAPIMAAAIAFGVSDVLFGPHFANSFVGTLARALCGVAAIVLGGKLCAAWCTHAAESALEPD